MKLSPRILLWAICVLTTSIKAEIDAIDNCGQRPCGVQYEPNNVLTEMLEYVNFYTSPLFYDPFGQLSGYGFTYYPPYIFASIDNSTITTLSNLGGILISNALYEVPPANGAVQVKAAFNYESFLESGTVTSPLGFDEDPFYATGIFGMVSLDTVEWQMVFLITNIRVYAMYAFYDGSGTNFFRYVIPVATRAPEEYATYSVTLESSKAVSWRINDKEVLRIESPNQPIDQRFETGLANPLILSYSFALPADVQMVFGGYRLTPIVNTADPTDIPPTACQRALFNQCRQSLKNAYGTNCQYASLTNYNNLPVFNITMNLDELSAISYTKVPGCPAEGNCKPKPVTCPHVKPEPRRKPVNPKPITTLPLTTRTTTTMTSMTSTVTTRVPCGCRPAPKPTISIAGLVYKP